MDESLLSNPDQRWSIGEWLQVRLSFNEGMPIYQALVGKK